MRQAPLQPLNSVPCLLPRSPGQPLPMEAAAARSESPSHPHCQPVPSLPFSIWSRCKSDRRAGTGTALPSQLCHWAFRFLLHRKTPSTALLDGKTSPSSCALLWVCRNTNRVCQDRVDF